MTPANHPVSGPTSRWNELLHAAVQRVDTTLPYMISGRITRSTGLVLEATGLRLAVGAGCRINICGSQQHWAEAEVVGFNGNTLYLMPQGNTAGLMPGARVVPIAPSTPRLLSVSHNDRNTQSAPFMSSRHLPVGAALLGRVVDGSGLPLDGRGALVGATMRPLISTPLNPMERASISDVLDVGIRAINGLLTVGRGQRMGLFAGSGVGKSILLGMMARFTQADIIIVALIGERSREVKEFIELNLGPEGLKRSVVVAAPADVSPLLRLQGAVYATRLAEYFRDEGKHVLLIMDSLTRYAMAQRELALAIGEPPATKGYPPSVFAKLPALVERAGNGAVNHNGDSGSITAFYTVLTEGDDQQDPIADSARAILDGHIVLSRRLAESGHYPAIDIEASISRVMHAVVPDTQSDDSRQFRHLLSTYQRNHDLIAVGAYRSGSNAQIDVAIQNYPRLEAYLQQGMHERVDYGTAALTLTQLFHTQPPQEDAHSVNQT